MNQKSSTTSASTIARNWRLESADVLRCFEWNGFGPVPAELGVGAERPGAVCRRPDGKLLSMHPAPDRWLLPDPPASLLDSLDQAERQELGVCTDVSGRWRTLVIVPVEGTGSQSHPLSAAMPLALVLAERGCAALWAFDCPVIVATNALGHEIWVEASYQASFIAMLATLGVKA